MRPIALLIALALFPAAAAAQSWCAASNLNQTEAAICGDALLGNLDAQMDTLYGRIKDRDARARSNQSAWLAARNFCRTDVLCIETAYRDQLTLLRQIPGGRPTWCVAANLSAPERAICGSSLLAHLDAELGTLFNRGGPTLRAVQRQWLKDERDTCGNDAFCIEQAYLSRLADLRKQPAN